jgi:hypothetical protein
MGVLLGWVAWHSKSTIPSIIVHVIHNSTLLIVVQSQDLLAKWNVGQAEAEHLPWWWLAISAALLTGGTGLAWLATGRFTSDAVQSTLNSKKQSLSAPSVADEPPE